MATKPISLIFMLLFEKFEMPVPNPRQNSIAHAPIPQTETFCLSNRAVLNCFRGSLLCYFEYCLELGFWILGFGFCVLESAALTTFCAASAKSSAAMTAR